MARSQVSASLNLRPAPLRVQARFDEGCKDNLATSGWYALASWRTDSNGVPDWREFATSAVYIEPGISMIAKMLTAEQAILAALATVSVGSIWLED